MARPIVYSLEMSPPCRGVLLAAEAIGLELQVQEVDLFSKHHLTEEFLKMNPQHTVPTLNDGGEYIWDSHAIMCYLVGKYGKDDSLYPKDLKKRAIIDQRLHFDSGLLFPLLRGMAKPIFFHGMKTLAEDKVQSTKDAYNFLNKFLDGKKWLAGDSYTLADISCVSSVSSLDALVPTASYPNIVRWLKTCEAELPGYAKVNAPGNKAFHEAVKAKLK